MADVVTGWPMGSKSKVSYRYSKMWLPKNGTDSAEPYARTNPMAFCLDAVFLEKRQEGIKVKVIKKK